MGMQVCSMKLRRAAPPRNAGFAQFRDNIKNEYSFCSLEGSRATSFTHLYVVLLYDVLVLVIDKRWSRVPQCRLASALRSTTWTWHNELRRTCTCTCTCGMVHAVTKQTKMHRRFVLGTIICLTNSDSTNSSEVYLQRST